MTNAALQAMITQFGDRITAIIFDNTQTLFIGYQSEKSVKITDVTVETIGGVEFTVVSQKTLHRNAVDEPITYKTYHLTECIQDVVVMDEKFKDYRVDPIHFK